MVLELPRSPAAAGKDRRAIAIGAVAADRQGLVEIVGPDDREHRSEDLLARHPHAGRDAVEHARTDQETVTLGDGGAAIEDDLGAFLAANLEIAGHPLEMLAG